MLCWLHHQSRAFANTSLTGHWSLATYLLGSSGSQYRFYGIKLLERCPLRQSVLQEQGSARNLGEATLMDMEEINLIETNIPRKPRSVRMIWFHFQRHIDLIIFSVCWSFSGEGDGLEQRAARNCSQIGGSSSHQVQVYWVPFLSTGAVQVASQLGYCLCWQTAISWRYWLVVETWINI